MNTAQTALTVSIISAGFSAVAVLVTVLEHFDARARRKAKVEVEIFKDSLYFHTNNPHFSWQDSEEPDLEMEALAEWHEAPFADQYVFVDVEVHNAGKGIARDVVLQGECFYSGGSEFSAHVRCPMLLPNATTAGRVRLETVKGVLLLSWVDEKGEHRSEVPLRRDSFRRREAS